MLLIFDCDGVILDSMVLHTEVEAAAYLKIGINVSPHELVRRFSGVPQNEVSRILQKETGVSVPEDLEIRIERHKIDVFAEKLRPIPGIYKTIEMLHDHSRCIASGTGLSGLEHMLGVVGLYESFAPHIYSSEMVPRGKPHPDLFLFAAEQMNTSPEDCLVIEDGVSGVKAAKSAGIRVLGFTGGSHYSDKEGEILLEAGAENVLKHITDLPRYLERHYSASQSRS